MYFAWHELYFINFIQLLDIKFHIKIRYTCYMEKSEVLMTRVHISVWHYMDEGMQQKGFYTSHTHIIILRDPYNLM